MSFLEKIATILNKTGHPKCQEKAKILANEVHKSMALHLRSLNLKSSDILAIASVLGQENTSACNLVSSISFSYNEEVGDDGAIALIKSFPSSISEVGLVGCRIGDQGGSEILAWMNNAPSLRMICIEQNNFTEKLKSQYRLFAKSQQGIIVVV